VSDTSATYSKVLNSFVARENVNLLDPETGHYKPFFSEINISGIFYIPMVKIFLITYA